MLYHSWNREVGPRRIWHAAVHIVSIGAAVALFFGLLVMLLWNAILPGVAGVRPVTYWQAVGLLVLVRILVGGFSRGVHGHHGHHHRRCAARQGAPGRPDPLDEFVEHGRRPGE
jgi:hypothetical protein